MKKLKNIILFSLTAIFITGCIEYNVKVTVNPDGTGTLRETVILGAGLVDMLNAFALFSDDEEDEFELYDEDELEEQAYEYGQGVKFVKGEEIYDKGREGYTALYKFNDITKIKVNQDPDDKMPSDEMSDDSKKKDPITFGFSEGSYSTLTVNIPGEFEPEDFDMNFDEDGVDDSDSKKLQKMLRDLRVLIQIEVNGDISETNAAYVYGSEITLMRFDMGEILENPEQFEYLKNKKPRNKAEAKELLEKIPGLKVELENQIEIKFR